jgi:hypothetical protein
VFLCAVVTEPPPDRVSAGEAGSHADTWADNTGADDTWADRSGRHQAALAAALHNLAIQQGITGRHQEALASAEESVAILRELTAPQPAGSPGVPQQRTAQPAEGGVTRVMALGFRRVLVLRVARLTYRSTRWPGLAVATASATLAGSWPLGLELVLYLTARRYALLTADAVSWVAALTVVNTAALVATWRSWSILDRAGPSIDDLLIRSSGRDRLVRWLTKTLGLWRQILFSVLAMVGACALLALAQPAIEDALEIGPVSYVAVAWTAYIAANDAYWLIVVARLGRRILRLRDLNLVWHSPASTPGIVQLSSAYTFGTTIILFLAIGVEVLALRVSAYGDSAVLRSVAITFPVVAALAALIFGILPHRWLYLAVRDARREVLRQLASSSGTTPVTAAEIPRAQGKISLYSTVESSPGLPFSTATMVQYTAAVIGTLVGTLLVILLGGGLGGGQSS